MLEIAPDRANIITICIQINEFIRTLRGGLVHGEIVIVIVKNRGFMMELATRSSEEPTPN